MTENSFGARSSLSMGDRTVDMFRVDVAGDSVARLPYSMKVLLENLLRHEDGDSVTAEDIGAVANWQGHAQAREIAFMPARVLMQDFTGVPAVVDLAAMRDGIEALGGDPARVSPQ
ncbi:MAG: aconitase family protein, partial [Microthrixaceae bacterium]